MFRYFTIFMTFFVAQFAYGASWSVQITYPDYEVKNFKLDDMEFKTFLPKTSWRCWIGETTFSSKKELKKIKCNYSIEKTGEFSQTISCGNESKYAEVVLDLVDEKKSLDFKLHVICKG